MDAAAVAGEIADLAARGLNELAYPITVVGIGPGSRDYLLPVAELAVLDADVLVGGRQALALFDSLDKERLPIGSDLSGVLEYIDTARRNKRVAVLLSGDPGFFSLLPRLRQRFNDADLSVVPGISSLQLACSRLGIKWDNLDMASVHGRGLDGLAGIAGAERAAVLTERKYPPAVVCRYLLERGSLFRQVWVLTDLALPGEKIVHGSLETVSGLPGMGNSILILLKDGVELPPLQSSGSSLVFGGDVVSGQGPDVLSRSEADETTDGAPVLGGSVPDISVFDDVVTPGLPDKLFDQGTAAMSQEEVRALTLCKARLRRGMIVYEIGAGTGSWTVETARLIAPGTVWAVERSPAAVALVRGNLLKFGIANVRLVDGTAPEACSDWPQADCILIGGSAGRLREILNAAGLGRWLRPGGRVVITAVTPDTFSTAWQLLQEAPWTGLDTVMINVARVAPRGSVQIWSGENPIFILSATLAG